LLVVNHVVASMTQYTLSMEPAYARLNPCLVEHVHAHVMLAFHKHHEQNNPLSGSNATATYQK